MVAILEADNMASGLIAMATTDEIQQKAEWRSRLMADVLSSAHDDETRCELLEAGLHQAHSEGVEDAAEICDGIARQTSSPQIRAVAETIAKALREYDNRNKLGRSARLSELDH